MILAYNKAYQKFLKEKDKRRIVTKYDRLKNIKRATLSIGSAGRNKVEIEGFLVPIFEVGTGHFGYQINLMGDSQQEHRVIQVSGISGFGSVVIQGSAGTDNPVSEGITDNDWSTYKNPVDDDDILFQDDDRIEVREEAITLRAVFFGAGSHRLPPYLRIRLV